MPISGIMQQAQSPWSCFKNGTPGFGRLELPVQSGDVFEENNPDAGLLVNAISVEPCDVFGGRSSPHICGQEKAKRRA
jgi:hypothetical protein